MSHFHILCITKCCLWPFLVESVLYHSRVHEFGAMQSPGCRLHRASAQASPPPRWAQPVRWLKSRQPGIGGSLQGESGGTVSSRPPPDPLALLARKPVPQTFCSKLWRSVEGRPHRVWSLKEGPSACMRQLKGGHGCAVILLFIVS